MKGEKKNEKCNFLRFDLKEKVSNLLWFLEINFLHFREKLVDERGALKHS
jgi:hypothetical protein